MDTGDWRTQFPIDSRQKIVHRMLEILKKHVSVHGQEDVQDLRRMAERFEEKIYTAATSQQDYLLNIKAKCQTPSANLIPLIAANNVQNANVPDCTAQTGNANGADWQGEIYQKQNQQSTIQQSTQSVIHEQSQSVLRQQQAPRLHEHKESIPPQPVIPAQQHKQLQQQQQQQLIAQTAGSANLQQSQLVGQKRAMPHVQKQLPQQRLVGHQNNYNNLQQQQQLLNQQNNLQNKHQQPLGSQSNVAGVQQQQFTGSQQPGNSNLTSNQHLMNLVQQSEAPVQKQMLQNTTTLVPSQCHQSHLHTAQQQMMSQSQSQPGQVQPPLGLQQQKNKLQMEMQQRLQPSGPLLQQHNVIEQQKQLYQPLRATPEASSNSTSQIGDENEADWQEEIYQEIMSMKEINLPKLNDICRRIASKMQQAKDTCAHETPTMGSWHQDSASDFVRLDGNFDGLGSGWNSACISGILATSGFDRLGSSSNALSSAAKPDDCMLGND